MKIDRSEFYNIQSKEVLHFLMVMKEIFQLKI